MILNHARRMMHRREVQQVAITYLSPANVYTDIYSCLKNRPNNNRTRAMCGSVPVGNANSQYRN